MELDYDDCAVVLRPDGGIDVYCPELENSANLPNVQLLRALLIALVRSVPSDNNDINELLEQIEEHLAPQDNISKILH